MPLFLLGAYSPPFLDFIESASVTTFPTTLFDALRGTSAWVPYVDTSWQGGNDLITGYLALNSGLLLMLGLVGILGRATRTASSSCSRCCRAVPGDHGSRGQVAGLVRPR